MKLYKIDTAPAGERWHSAKTGLKSPTEVELPKDGRAGMAKFLNDNELELVGVGLLPPTQIDPLEVAELRAVAAATTMPKSEAQQDFEERRAAAVARHQDVDGLVEWMLDAETWQLARIFEAVGERLGTILNATG